MNHISSSVGLVSCLYDTLPNRFGKPYYHNQEEILSFEVRMGGAYVWSAKVLEAGLFLIVVPCGINL